MQMEGHHKTELNFFFQIENSSGRTAGISGTVVNPAYHTILIIIVYISQLDKSANMNIIEDSRWLDR